MTVDAGSQRMEPFPLRSPGFVQMFAGPLPPAGFLLEYDGYWVCTTLDTIRTIGAAGSGAAIAQSWLDLLYELIWKGYNNTQAPIFSSTGASTTRGTSASADWNANKRLSLPDMRGRTMVGVGAGSNPSVLTARSLGATFGAETHTLSLAEIPSHTHTLRINSGLVFSIANSGSGANTVNNDAGFSQGGFQWLNDSVGGSGSHNNVQPSIAQHFLVSAGSR